VDYDAENAPVVDWTPATTTPNTKKPVTIIKNNTNETDLSNTTGYVLVVPETSSSISFDYQIEGSSAKLHYVIPGNTWEHGKNYIFNIKVTPKEIQFSPEVLGWTEVPNNAHNNL
jgi:hypothetical protein